MPPTEETKEALKTSLFDCSPLSDGDILALLEWMFHDFGLPDKFHIDTRTLRAFLYEVYKNYNEVPFHNFRHGFCVTQMVSPGGAMRPPAAARPVGGGRGSKTRPAPPHLYYARFAVRQKMFFFSFFKKENDVTE